NFLIRKTLDRSKPNRRDFMVQSTCASLGITSAVNTLSQLQLAGMASAAGATDYKALLCIFQAGGNDSNNLLIPTGATTARADYELGRGTPTYAGGAGGLGIPLGELTATAITSTDAVFDPSPGYTNNNMALHPACPEMKALFDLGNLALVANIGTLTSPDVTRTNFGDVLPSKPPQLFSHADQVLQWQSSIADQPFVSGWGGRVADDLAVPGATLGMGISIAGVNSFQVGLNEQPFITSTSGSPNFAGYGSGNVGYAQALVNPALKPFASVGGYDPLADTNYQANGQGWRLKALEKMMAMNHANLFDSSYEDTAKTARFTEGVMADTLAYTNGTGGPSLDPYFLAAFGNNTTAAAADFALQMKMAARLIIGNYALLSAGLGGNKRQTFFIQQGGYDTHASQIAINGNNTVNTGVGQFALLATLSKSIKGFYDSIMAHPQGGAALWQAVTGFSSSDFCRTFTPNKTDSTGGSDHGWGGHAFVVGGSVVGKKVYGKFPTLQVNAGIDCTGSRGRWIPSTSVDQYAAKLAAWLGVQSGDIPGIFPNLSRFGPGPNLNFI
ncbi:MAG: hypothetical protein JWO89_2239, partial [Verrucomicrobiaceae bacterium]|nr:hypothetical protein [Verrucomicrobiaceae bacterium]